VEREEAVVMNQGVLGFRVE
jgi:hypothetical protein